MSIIFFFFSSRRRHTRCSRDWSSDVCSSDLSDVLVRITTCHRVYRVDGHAPEPPKENWKMAKARMAAEAKDAPESATRSEEHTSELQSRLHLVCRLLLEKKKKNDNTHKHFDY